MNMRLLAVDGHYVNTGLWRQSLKNVGINDTKNLPSTFPGVPRHLRAKLNYSALLDLLLGDVETEGEYPDLLNYYVSKPAEVVAKIDNCLVGEVYRYKSDRGYGFIKDTQGNSYFAHQTEIRMPGFRTLEEGSLVRFIPSQNEKGMLAKEIYPLSPAEQLEFKGSVSKGSFYQILQNVGFEIIYCRPHPLNPQKRSKSVDLQIAVDACLELGEDDTFILFGGDDTYTYLLEQIKELGANITLVVFDEKSLSGELEEVADECIVLEEHPEVFYLDEDPNFVRDATAEMLASKDDRFRFT